MNWAIRPLATDARGFTSITQRNEIGWIYRTIAPEPYAFTVETYYDANGNVTRVDTQDWQVAYTSGDPTSPGHGQITPTGGGYSTGSGGAVGSGATGYSATAHVPMQPGPSGTIRPGWFTNLYQYNVLDWKIQDDIDATGSTPSNLITAYSYDPNGNLTMITRPEGNTVQYDYDERNLKIAQLVGANPAFQINESQGALTIWFYDANGMLGSIIGPAMRGEAGNSLMGTLADAFGTSIPLTPAGDWVVQNFYDGFDRVYQSIDAAGNVAAYSFDPTGRVIQTSMYGPVGGAVPVNRSGGSNVLLSQSASCFDEAGRAYQQQQNVFVAAGTTLPSGRTVTQHFGALMNNSTGTRTGSFQIYPITTWNTSSYVLNQMVYDRAGRPTQMLADNAGATATVYDGAGRAITVTDALGNVTAYAYDGNGNAVSILRTDVCTITSPAVTNEQFASATFYDCLNRPVITAAQGPDGSFVPNIAVPSGIAWSTLPATLPGWSSTTGTLFGFAGYDSRGNAALSVDPKGNSVITLYDGAGRGVETDQLLRQGGSGTSGPQPNQSFLPGGRSLIRTQMVYDGNSRLTTLIDDRGNETGYTYDLLDRQVTMTFQDGSTRTNSYDLAGDVVGYTDENGSAFTNSFDVLGRKYDVSIATAYNVSTSTTIQQFQFDGLSRLTSYYDNSQGGAGQIVYDSLGRLLEDAQYSSTYVTHTAFTSWTVSAATYPSGRAVNAAYDLLYRKNFINDSSGTIAAWQFSGGRVAEVALGNGIICTQMNNARTHSAVQSSVPNPNPGWNTSSDCIGYDGSGRMITKRYLAGGISSATGAYNNSTPVVGFTTSFDPSSNKLFEFHLHAPTRSHLYPGYDSADRLLSYQRGQFNASAGPVYTPIALPNTDAYRTYNLDGLGNWKNTAFSQIQSGGSAGPTITDVRRHNSTNELTQFNPTGSAAVNVAYDTGSNFNNANALIAARGNGNIINDGTRKYQFDALNRLTMVKNQSGGTIAQYKYDALNRRVYKTVTGGGITGTVPNVTTTYFYDGNQCLEERNSGTTSRQFVWGHYIDELIQMKTGVTLGAQSLAAGTYYLLSDLLYRSVALTSTSGSIVETYDTDAYGNTIIFTAAGTGGNWFANNATQAAYCACENIFTGRQYDPETLIYFYRARYYSPPLGRFFGKDLIGYRGGINLYAYVSSSPIVSLDPFGLNAVVDWCETKIQKSANWLLTGDTDPSQEVLDAANAGYVEGWGSLHALAYLVDDSGTVGDYIDPEGNKSLGQLMFTGHLHADPVALIPAIHGFQSQAANQWDCYKDCMASANRFGLAMAGGALGGNFDDLPIMKIWTKPFLNPGTYQLGRGTAGSNPWSLLDPNNIERIRSFRMGRTLTKSHPHLKRQIN